MLLGMVLCMDNVTSDGILLGTADGIFLCRVEGTPLGMTGRCWGRAWTREYCWGQHLGPLMGQCWTRRT